MLKKMFAASGLLFATVAGTMLTSSPASAQLPNDHGFGAFRHAFRSFHRAANLNEAVNFNRIRIRIHNTNNNVAVATNREQE